MDKALLLILDGWGIGDQSKADAIFQAKTPVMDDLKARYPFSTLTTFGERVGLPYGQMGNSEVGHMNIGAGRIVHQDLLQINTDIESKAFQERERLVRLMNNANKSGKKLHFIGLLSDGGVHSHIDHLIALIEMADTNMIDQVYIHAFLDGRDTDPHGGMRYLKELLNAIKNKSSRLGTIIGRYFAMDRDERWERTKLAYDLLCHGKGMQVGDVLQAVQSKYDEGESDEFMKPLVVDAHSQIAEGDSVLFFNFRADRPRQLTSMLCLKPYPEVGSQPIDIDMYSMTIYDATFKSVQTIYSKNALELTLGEQIAKLGGTQVRMAETEKYPHVTYFFSGGREAAFVNEKRILVSSPKVATYDLQPEMSAKELSQSLLDHLNKEQPNFICLNFANADMVGHTGVFDAAIRAVEAVDQCVGDIVKKSLNLNYRILIIADHGNSDYMINEDGTPNTAHSVNPVPCICVMEEAHLWQLKSGALADIAPTLCNLLGIPPSELMTGSNLLIPKS